MLDWARRGVLAEVGTVDVATKATKPWTADELSRLPEGWRYEIDEGALVIMAPAGIEHGDISLGVGAMLRQFVRSRGLGKVVGSETGFFLKTEPQILRAPDVAFISNARLARIRDPKQFSDVPPDLAVEIRSPSEAHVDIRRKVEQYLLAGVRSVWVIDPDGKTLTQYRQNEAPVTIVDPDARVEDPVLPGFVCRLRELFGEA